MHKRVKPFTIKLKSPRTISKRYRYQWRYDPNLEREAVAAFSLWWKRNGLPYDPENPRKHVYVRRDFTTRKSRWTRTSGHDTRPRNGKRDV
jgi:hypothetical protein